MGTKAAELAAMLKNKKIFHVNIEQPNKDTTVETTIEDPNGIAFSVQNHTITFTGNGKTASFMVLEDTQIIANLRDNTEVISTFAENGGLQIKSVI